MPHLPARPLLVSAILTTTLALLLLLPASASAIGFSLTPVAGSTTGVVGDTFVVGVDLVLAEGDYVTIAGPTLQWDLEGGNVLDARAAFESSVLVGRYQLNPLVADRWRIGDATDSATSEVYWSANTFDDRRAGPTFFWGFEQVTTVLDEDGILLDINAYGIAGAGSYRIGTIEFLLREVGTTEISYLVDPAAPWRTFVAGSNAVELSGDQLVLTPLAISANGVAALKITVVPEPGTVVFLGLGLALLARPRARPAD